MSLDLQVKGIMLNGNLKVAAAHLQVKRLGLNLQHTTAHSCSQWKLQNLGGKWLCQETGEPLEISHPAFCSQASSSNVTVALGVHIYLMWYMVTEERG